MQPGICCSPPKEQARRWRHGDMDVEHLLQVLFSNPRYGSWIDSLPIDPDRLARSAR